MYSMSVGSCKEFFVACESCTFPVSPVQNFLCSKVITVLHPTMAKTRKKQPRRPPKKVAADKANSASEEEDAGDEVIRVAKVQKGVAKKKVPGVQTRHQKAQQSKDIEEIPKDTDTDSEEGVEVVQSPNLRKELAKYSKKNAASKRKADSAVKVATKPAKKRKKVQLEDKYDDTEDEESESAEETWKVTKKTASNFAKSEEKPKAGKKRRKLTEEQKKYREGSLTVDSSCLEGLAADWKTRINQRRERILVSFHCLQK